MKDTSPSSKVDPSKLTWVGKLLSILAKTSGWDFSHAAGRVKAALSIPVGIVVLGVVSSFMILVFGQPFDSRAAIWAFELFQQSEQTYLYPDIATETGWIGTARGALEIALLLISFGIGYLILNCVLRDADELPKIEVGLGGKIASWVGFFLLLIVPSFLAVFATGKLTDLASSYAPRHPEPFEMLPAKHEITFSGERLKLDRTGSVVLYDSSVERENVQRTGRYFENIGYLRDGRASKIRMSAEIRSSESNTIYQIELPIARRWEENRTLDKVARMIAMDLSDFVEGHDENLSMQIILVSATELGDLYRDTTTVVRADTSEVKGYTLSSNHRCCMYKMSER